MIMDSITLENFINYCDDMMIAEEGLLSKKLTLSKDLFDLSMSNTLKKEDKAKYNKEEQEFLFNKETGEPIKRSITDFKNGLKIPGKLLPKRIKGGIILRDTYYEMR